MEIISETLCMICVRMEHSQLASRQLQQTVDRLRSELSDVRLSEQVARQRMQDAEAEAATQLHQSERMQQLATEEREVSDSQAHCAFTSA